MVRLTNSPWSGICVLGLTYIAMRLFGIEGLYVIAAYFAVAILARVASTFSNSWRKTNRYNAKIVVFRPFSEKNSAIVRNTIVPLLSCYGSVTLIADTSFKRSSPYWSDSWFVPSTHGGIEPDEFADLDEMPDPSADWQDRLLPKISAADAAIVILDVNGISTSLQWEIAQSISYIGAEKLLAISVSSDNQDIAMQVGINTSCMMPYQTSYRWRRNLLHKLHQSITQSEAHCQS